MSVKVLYKEKAKPKTRGYEFEYSATFYKIIPPLKGGHLLVKDFNVVLEDHDYLSRSLLCLWK